MNDIKQTYFIEVWHSPKLGLCWSERTFFTVKSFNRFYDHTRHYYGKTATVHAGTHDYDIPDADLLKAATDHVLGHCVTFQYDLKNCIVTKIHGRPPTPDY